MKYDRRHKVIVVGNSPNLLNYSIVSVKCKRSLHLSIKLSSFKNNALVVTVSFKGKSFLIYLKVKNH